MSYEVVSNDVRIPRGLIETIGDGTFQMPLMHYGTNGSIDLVKIYSSSDMVTLEFIARDGQLVWRVNFYPPPA